MRLRFEYWMDRLHFAGLDPMGFSLSNLHQDGKLIGVISHVPALKERIPTQINLIPLSGGKSKLAGPGCRMGGNEGVSSSEPTESAA